MILHIKIMEDLSKILVFTKLSKIVYHDKSYSFETDLA